jgi:hypothetical protein
MTRPATAFELDAEAPGEEEMPETAEGLDLPWMKIVLSGEEVAHNAHLEIRDRFERARGAAGRPPGAAIFESVLPGPDGTFDFFFTPEAAVLARAVFELHVALSCAPPERSLVSHLAGDPRAFERLRP